MTDQPKAAAALAEMQRTCAKVSRLFTPEMRITLIARDPSDPKAFLLASDDDTADLGRFLSVLPRFQWRAGALRGARRKEGRRPHARRAHVGPVSGLRP